MPGQRAHSQSGRTRQTPVWDCTRWGTGGLTFHSQTPAWPCSSRLLILQLREDVWLGLVIKKKLDYFCVWVAQSVKTVWLVDVGSTIAINRSDGVLLICARPLKGPAESQICFPPWTPVGLPFTINYQKSHNRTHHILAPCLQPSTFFLIPLCSAFHLFKGKNTWWYEREQGCHLIKGTSALCDITTVYIHLCVYSFSVCWQNRGIFLWPCDLHCVFWAMITGVERP